MTKPDFEDIMLWPDETWCYRYELEEMQHKSDDYQVLYFDSPEYNKFTEALYENTKKRTFS